MPCPSNTQAYSYTFSLKLQSLLLFSAKESTKKNLIVVISLFPFQSDDTFALLFSSNNITSHYYLLEFVFISHFKILPFSPTFPHLTFHLTADTLSSSSSLSHYSTKWQLRRSVENVAKNYVHIFSSLFSLSLAFFLCINYYDNHFTTICQRQERILRETNRLSLLHLIAFFQHFFFFLFFAYNKIHRVYMFPFLHVI